MSTCRFESFKPCRTLTCTFRLADRDMFMRFRGGGVGHMYMRQVEPWLDATGWGTAWPLLKNRDPDPDPEPMAPALVSQATEDDEESEDEDSGDESSDMEDDDGEDPEQSEDDEDNSDDDDGGGGVKKHTEGGEGGRNGEDSNDKAEEHVQQYADL